MQTDVLWCWREPESTQDEVVDYDPGGDGIVVWCRFSADALSSADSERFADGNTVGAVVARSHDGFFPVYAFGDHSESETDAESAQDGDGPESPPEPASELRGKQSVLLSYAIADIENRLSLPRRDVTEFLENKNKLLGADEIRSQPPPDGWAEKMLLGSDMWWEGDHGGGTFLTLYNLRRQVELGKAAPPQGRQIARIWYNGMYFFAKYYGSRNPGRRFDSAGLWSNVGSGSPHPSLSEAVSEVEQGRALARLLGYGR